jgi:sugar phosphate isomerase/epimerase
MKISVQLYSLRDAGDIATQLRLVREADFDYVESVSTHGLPASEFASLVASHGLQVPSMHVALARLEADFASVVDDCRAVRCPLVVMPWLPMGERPATAAGWSTLGVRLAALGDRLHEQGLRLAYHNHDFEFLRYDGRTALEWLFDEATPSQLGWEADIGWVCRAGADPFEWTSRYADRLLALHAKDIAPPRAAVDEDGWAALGEGIVPWRRLLNELAHVPLVIFEHDRPKDARAVLRTSRAFLERHATGAGPSAK